MNSLKEFNDEQQRRHVEITHFLLGIQKLLKEISNKSSNQTGKLTSLYQALGGETAMAVPEKAQEAWHIKLFNIIKGLFND